MKTINVYTKEDRNVNEVIKELKSEFGNTFIKYSNMDEGIISIILCIFAFLIAMLVAARIRKISSAELIME